MNCKLPTFPQKKKKEEKITKDNYCFNKKIRTNMLGFKKKK